jgi:hypothetical protein
VHQIVKHSYHVVVLNVEMNTIPIQNRRRSHSIRSSSSTSINFGTNLQPIRNRATLERTSDLDKFDTLLMLAAERSSRSDIRIKQPRYSSTSPPQRKAVPLLLVEQQTSNHVSNLRPQHVRFTTSPGMI